MNTSQVVDVPQFLIQSRERVISRDDMLAVVWRGRIVSEAILKAGCRSKRLPRLALEDEARAVILGGGNHDGLPALPTTGGASGVADLRRDAVEETRTEGPRIKPPKTAAGVRDLVMPDVVVEALQDLRRKTLERHLAMGLRRPTDNTLVFPKILDGNCQSPNSYSGDWRAAVLALKLPDVSLHALRHTHVSQLIDAGVDIVRISKRIGHADPAVTLSVWPPFPEARRHERRGHQRGTGLDRQALVTKCDQSSGVVRCLFL